MTGVDLSAAMADRASSQYDRVIVGDMVVALGGLDADVIVCSGALYYLRDLAPFLSATFRALRRNGFAIISDFPAPEGGGVMVTIGGTRRYCRAPDLVRRLAADAGFTTVESEPGLSFRFPVRFWRLGTG